MSTEQYKKWFENVDADNSGELTYSELYDFLTQQRGYSDKQVESIFDMADTNRDGVITLDEFVQNMFEAVDTSGDSKVSLNEFVDLMTATPRPVHSESALRMVCKSFDKNGDGTIDKSELKAVFEELGRDMNDDELSRIMKMTDTDGDGTIDYNELCEKVFGQSCD